MTTKKQFIQRARRERMLRREKEKVELPESYFCATCRHYHKKGSKIYDRHLQ